MQYLTTIINLVDVSDIFFCSGEGKGESEAPGEVGDFLLKNPRRAGSPGWVRAGGGGQGAGRVFAGNGGGGAKHSEPKICHIWHKQFLDKKFCAAVRVRV